MKEEAELNNLAMENIEWTLSISRDSLNSGRFGSRVERGDRVMLRNMDRQIISSGRSHPL